MIKSILVASGGGSSDMSVLETALAAAQPLGAHLEVFHLQPRLGEAVLNTPHADMAVGFGVSSTLEKIGSDIDSRSRQSVQHFVQFCARHHIECGNRATRSDEVSASWREVQGDSLECLTFAAHHHDLMVMGRPSTPNGLPTDLIELLILRSGCPVLVAPASGRQSLTGTILIAWKECPQAARALAAAMPLLAKADRVIVIGVTENDRSTADMIRAGLDHTVRRLVRHGVHAERQFIEADGRPVFEVIAAAAEACAASLIVMGAYGRSRISELVFGGCTEHFLRDKAAAILFAH